jgi:hypothetical protein
LARRSLSSSPRKASARLSVCFKRCLLHVGEGAWGLCRATLTSNRPSPLRREAGAAQRWRGILRLSSSEEARSQQSSPDSPLEGNGFELSVPRRESNESHSGTGTVTEATKVRLKAVAYLPGTDGSNPFPSTGESVANWLSGRRLPSEAGECAQVDARPPF